MVAGWHEDCLSFGTRWQLGNLRDGCGWEQSDPIDQPRSSGPQKASWSPDGTKIVFTSLRNGGDNDIYMMDSDGNNVIDLSNNTFEDGPPSWSPDGTKIVLSSIRNGNRDLYVIDADGSNPRRLWPLT